MAFNIKKVGVPLIIIALVIGAVYIGTGGRFSAVPIGTILSLSQVSYSNSYNGNDNFAQGQPVWLANVILNNMGQELRGYTINQPINGSGQTSRDSVSLDVDRGDMACHFTVSQVGNGQAFTRKQLVASPAFQYTYGVVFTRHVNNPASCLDFGVAYDEYNNYESACTAIGGTPINCDPNGNAPYQYRKCLMAGSTGDTYRMAGLNTPYPEWHATINFYKGNDAAQSITLGNDQLVDISPNGNLQGKAIGVLPSPSNAGCPGNQEMIFAPQHIGIRNIVSPGSAQALDSLRTQTALPTTVCGASCLHETGQGSASSLLDTWNGRIQSLLTNSPPDNQFSANPWSPIQGSGGVEGVNGIRLDRSANPFASPDLQLIIKATWLQIVEQISHPTINSFNPPSFDIRPLNQQNIQVTFGNQGTGQAEASSWTCSNALVSVYPTADNFNVVPGQTTTRSYQFSGGSEIGNVSCTVRATDSTGNNAVTSTIYGQVRRICTTTCQYPAQVVNADCNCVCPTPAPTCGSNEIYSPTDCTCHPRPSNCGNGVCDSGETYLNCPTDNCPIPACTVCPDQTAIGVCSTQNPGLRCVQQTPQSCVLQNDTQCGQGTCPSGQHMENGVCVPNVCTGIFCGDIPWIYIGGGIVLLLVLVYGSDQGWFSKITGKRRR